MILCRGIQTKRLVLEPFSEKHLTAEYIRWLNDPLVIRYSEQRYRKHTLATCRKYLESFSSSDNCFWAILVREGGDGGIHIGNLNAYIDLKNKVADLGILIGAKEYWGKGYATEAWNNACRYFFSNCGLRKITAGCLSSNNSMIRLLERAGMVPDGRRIRQCLWKDHEVDILHYALFHDSLNVGK